MEFPQQSGQDALVAGLGLVTAGGLAWLAVLFMDFSPTGPPPIGELRLIDPTGSPSGLARERKLRAVIQLQQGVEAANVTG